MARETLMHKCQKYVNKWYDAVLMSLHFVLSIVITSIHLCDAFLSVLVK